MTNVCVAASSLRLFHSLQKAATDEKIHRHGS
jgi:hypothetical protein